MEKIIVTTAETLKELTNMASKYTNKKDRTSIIANSIRFKSNGTRLYAYMTDTYKAVRTFISCEGYEEIDMTYRTPVGLKLDLKASDNKIILKDDCMIIVNGGSTYTFEALEKISIDMDEWFIDNNFTMAFDPKELIDALSVFKGNYVKLNFNTDDTTSPVIMQNSNSTIKAILLPMRTH